MALSNVSFAAAAKSHWEESCSGGLLCEETYTTVINNTFCYIVLKENGDVEAGAEEKSNKDRVLSYAYISNDGRVLKNSSSSEPISKSTLISYYHPEGPGYDVFNKKCYSSVIKAENIPMDTREIIKKALERE